MREINADGKILPNSSLQIIASEINPNDHFRAYLRGEERRGKSRYSDFSKSRYLEFSTFLITQILCYENLKILLFLIIQIVCLSIFFS